MGGEVNPFFAGGAIADRRYFVGRSPELREIFSKMFADQPTSINVVGPEKIGKSSLLRQVARVYEERAEVAGRMMGTECCSSLELLPALGFCLQDTWGYIPGCHVDMWVLDVRNQSNSKLLKSPFYTYVFHSTLEDNVEAEVKIGRDEIESIVRCYTMLSISPPPQAAGDHILN